jgi:hypothetical protein
MKLKLFPLLLVFLLTFAVNISAQTGNKQHDSRRRIETRKIAFLTDKLQLTVAEAQIFWPLYNEYQAKRNKCLSGKREVMSKYRKNKSTLSDAQIEKISDEIVALNLKEAQLKQEYHSKLKKVLPIKKVLRLYQAEDQFKTLLLKNMNKQKKQRQH